MENTAYSPSITLRPRSAKKDTRGRGFGNGVYSERVQAAPGGQERGAQSIPASAQGSSRSAPETQKGRASGHCLAPEAPQGSG